MPFEEQKSVIEEKIEAERKRYARHVAAAAVLLGAIPAAQWMIWVFGIKNIASWIFALVALEAIYAAGAYYLYLYYGKIDAVTGSIIGIVAAFCLAPDFFSDDPKDRTINVLAFVSIAVIFAVIGAIIGWKYRKLKMAH